ncbi:MAG: CAP domain-containing protein [bacterium]|nr:CAP domain-containing protein [bacterium]
MINKKFLFNTAAAVFVFTLLLAFPLSAFGASLNSKTLVNAVNAQRIKTHTGALVTSQTLQRAAQQKADDMAQHTYFSHTSPQGKTPWYWFKNAGYSYSYAGENLAVQYSSTNEVVNSWMQSSGHRANIMNKNFTETGIGISQGYLGNNPVTYVVQFFAKPTIPALKAKPAQKQKTVQPIEAKPVQKQKAVKPKQVPVKKTNPTKKSASVIQEPLVKPVPQELQKRVLFLPQEERISFTKSA